MNLEDLKFIQKHWGKVEFDFSIPQKIVIKVNGYEVLDALEDILADKLNKTYDWGKDLGDDNHVIVFEKPSQKVREEIKAFSREMNGKCSNI